VSKIQLKSILNPVSAAGPTTKTVRNKSVQGFSIILNSSSGYKTVWLSPRQKITVLESEITQQIRNLHDRRLVSIEN